jgi:DNA-binding beta-propeller fold protein YncE
MPDSISYLGPHLLVVQTGSNISVYDTQTHKVVQKYQSDQESPDVQVAPQSNMILFLNNNSIFQIRQTNTPTIKYFNTSWFNWVYELGISGNAIMVHEISLDGTKHTLFYFYTDSGSSSVHM